MKPLDPAELRRMLDGLTDDGAYLVLADWLQSHDHPWGRLIAFQHAAAREPDPIRKEELGLEAEIVLYDHGPEILGDLAKRARFTWRDGLARTATIGAAAEPAAIVAAAAELLAHPVAHLLEGVAVNPAPARLRTAHAWDAPHEDMLDPWPAALEPLARVLPARVVELGLGGWPAPAAIAHVVMPRFDDVSRRFPGLRRLELTGAARDDPGRLVLPALAELEVRYAAALARNLYAIVASELPRLERLAVWLGGSGYCTLDELHPPHPGEDGRWVYVEDYESDDLDRMRVRSADDVLEPAALGQFLARVPASVHELGLKSAVLTGPLCDAIVRSPRVHRLRTLDLSHGTLDDRSARPLIEGAAVLARLEAIIVEKRDLSANARDRLARALPNLRFSEARQQPHAPSFCSRYVATYE